MFEVPAAKRVKRSKLFDDDASELDESIHTNKAGENSNHESQPDVIPSYGFEYDFIDQQPRPINENQAPDEPGQPQDEAEAETFQFNLFRPNPNLKPSRSQDEDKDPSATATAAPQSKPKPAPVLISLRSPSPLNVADPSLALRQHRPDSYYFTVTASTPPEVLKSLRASYAESAISAATIHQQLARSWSGMYLPWRVVELPAHARQVVVHRMELSSDDTSRSVTGQSLDEKTSGRGRARPSKKRREVRKGKARARQRIIDESKTKEEHEREKKNRKNRERKLKRRAKERRERGEGRVGTGSGEGEGGEGGGSKDDEGSEAGSGHD